jgi:hypothetical protein
MKTSPARKGADKKAPVLFNFLTQKPHPDSADRKDTHLGRPRAQIAGSAFRFGTDSVFGFMKPFHFLDLQATRSESRHRQVRHTIGFGRRSDGATKNRSRFLNFLLQKQRVGVPHNPLL